jgi:cell wall-associated NlpC family hydrolase
MDPGRRQSISDSAALLVARGFLGTPFRHQGRLPRVGLDCVGLLVATAKAFGMSPSDCTTYSLIPKEGVLIPYLEKNLVRSERGLVASFWIRRPTDPPYHCAIIDWERNTMIHAFTSIGKVVEQTYSPFWQKRTTDLWQLSLSQL